MPNKGKHAITGALIAAGAYALNQRNKNEPIMLGDMLSFALGGGCVACLPDILEPAEHPNHRQFFHSITLICGLGICLDSALKNNEYDNIQKLMMKALAAAYGSHLFLDGATPKSLPLL